MSTTALALTSSGSIDRYVADISRHALLSREEEYGLAYRVHFDQDIEAAERLVLSNLRFVVKIAHEYRATGFPLMDIIQEGNVGLMRAIKKFDPTKGYRLISYAVWWIRACIQDYVQKSWSLVKIGTTQAQRKIFTKLKKTRRALTSVRGEEPEAAELAEALGVKESELSEMDMRMAARDFSLDVSLDDEGAGTTHMDMLRAETPYSDVEGAVESAETCSMVREAVDTVLPTLKEKEQYIVENRLMTDDPQSLAEIGRHFGISRERVRQLETRVIKTLKAALPEPQLLPA